MKKGRVFHLEDHPEWIEHIRSLLGDEYDLYSAKNIEDAAKLFLDLANEHLKVDVAIIDISLVLGDEKDKKGFEFIDLLEKSDVMHGYNIIVLTGFPEVDQNLRVAFRDYNVVDVFDKGTFIDEKDIFKQRIEEIISNS